MLARVVISGGMFLVLTSLFADPLGLSPAFGWSQALGVGVRPRPAQGFARVLISSFPTREGISGPRGARGCPVPGGA